LNRKLFTISSLSFLMFTIYIVPVNAAISTYSITIPGTWNLDVDTGTVVAGDPTRDFQWAIISGPPYEGVVAPYSGVTFVNLGIVDFDSICDVSGYNFLDIALDDDDLPVGTVVLIHTNLGNYAKMRIDGINYNLEVTVVIQNDGSPNLCASEDLEPVGGDVFSVDKLTILAPYLLEALAILTAISFLIKKRKH